MILSFSVQLSRLTIYFKESQFLTFKRSELYGVTDFLANCGGLLGLFMGVSLLSLVEILYFCLIRPCLILRSSMRSKHADDNQLLLQSTESTRHVMWTRF